MQLTFRDVFQRLHLLAGTVLQYAAEDILQLLVPQLEQTCELRNRLFVRSQVGALEV